MRKHARAECVITRDAAREEERGGVRAREGRREMERDRGERDSQVRERENGERGERKRTREGDERETEHESGRSPGLDLAQGQSPM
jgi:hypothetical protein